MAIREHTTLGLTDKFQGFISEKLISLYDVKRDVLFILRVGGAKQKPAVATDVKGEFWIRLDPRTGGIDSLEIEDFEKLFLPKHPELRSSWAKAKAFEGENNTLGRKFLSEIVGVLQEIRRQDAAVTS